MNTTKDLDLSLNYSLDTLPPDVSPTCNVSLSMHHAVQQIRIRVQARNARYVYRTWDTIKNSLQKSLCLPFSFLGSSSRENFIWRDTVCELTIMSSGLKFRRLSASHQKSSAQCFSRKSLLFKTAPSLTDTSVCPWRPQHHIVRCFLLPVYVNRDSSQVNRKCQLTLPHI